MSFRILAIVPVVLIGVAFGTPAAQERAEISLEELEPEHYRYAQAETCVNCHQAENDVMTRAVGVDISSGTPVLDDRGWLASVHARSQSHGDRINTQCAWCHAPTVPGATQDTAAAKPIGQGTWQGMTCGACHPVQLDESLRESLLVNVVPGSDLTDPANYVFIDRSDPVQVNGQCEYCHYSVHELLSAAKMEMMASGSLRCIDCHMAGYATAENQLVERFHNMKVEANGPLSCSGSFGTEGGCHANASEDWVRTAIPKIKGPRAD